MGIPLESQAVKAYADVTEYCFVELDTSHTSYPDVYCNVSSARGDHVFAIAEANAEADENETIQYRPLKVGCIYPITLGETVAVGEQICAGASGYGYDADTSNDVCVGTCVKGGDAAAIGFVLIDTNFGRVIA